MRWEFKRGNMGMWVLGFFLLGPRETQQVPLPPPSSLESCLAFCKSLWNCGGEKKNKLDKNECGGS